MNRTSRQFITFIKKEFAHVLRDRKTLLILFGLPIVQIMIFGFALSNEVKNSRLLVVDHAKDEISRAIISKLEASKYFDLRETHASSKDIEETFKEGKVQLAIVFPSSFGSDLLHFNHASLQVIADASDPNTANTLTNYLTNIVMDYQNGEQANQSVPLQIGTQIRMLYN
ncbi:MAG: ABC transporter permease, partial [Cyclobacteriaceae bacterium]